MRIDTHEALTSDPDCILENIVSTSDRIVRDNQILHKFMGTSPPSVAMYGCEIDQKRFQLTRAQFMRMKMSEHQLDTFFKQRDELRIHNDRIYEKLIAWVDELEDVK